MRAGQRDKPFVSESEHELRTPRPDLLDRPYAPDYSGESFRTQYKVSAHFPVRRDKFDHLFFHISSSSNDQFFAPIQNSIIEAIQKPFSAFRKSSTNDEALKKYQQKPYHVPAHWSTVQPKAQSQLSTPTQPPKVDAPFQPHSSNNDLKVASSQDSRRSENELNFEHNDIKNDSPPRPKPLVVEYQPPFLHPIYNRDYKSPSSTSTLALPLSLIGKTSTKITPEVRKTTKIFSTRVTTPAAPTARSTIVNQVRSNAPSLANRIEGRILTKASSPAAFTVATEQATVPLSSLFSTPAPFAPIIPEPTYPDPPNGLLPPFETFKIPDSNTHGPPLIFEWKIPAHKLEPPHFDDKNTNALSIDDNQIPVIPPETAAKPFVAIPLLEKDLVPPLFDASTNANRITTPENTLRPPLFAQFPVANDTDVAASNHSQPTLATLNDALQNFSTDLTQDKSQTPRSVTTTTSNRHGETTTNEINYLDLQHQFSIPDYTFPLETVQRPGYQNANAVNSFQIKIPEKKKPHWYGENANCPECHPSFLKPGTCEPCIKLR